MSKNQENLESPKPIVCKAELRDRTNIPGLGPNLRYVTGELREGMVYLPIGNHPDVEYALIPLEACSAIYVLRVKP